MMLDICGLVERRAPDISLSERLQKLRVYERAWRDLAWTDSLEIAFPPFTRRSIVRLSDSFLVLCSVSTGESNVAIHRIPSGLRSLDHVQYAWDKPIDTVDLIMDTARELIILFEAFSNANGSVPCVKFLGFFLLT
jgi:hypothetical protein